MNFRNKTKDGFTLVEMLVVVLLIAVLAGLIFRMTTMANDRSAKAVTVSRIAKLQAAIEEFYAEYGQYPPVPNYDNNQPMRFEYPSYEQLVTISGKAGNVASADSGSSDWHESWGKAPVFTFGLMSFLLPRFNDLGDSDFDGFGNFDGGANAGRESSTSSKFALNLGSLKQWTGHNSDTKKDNTRDVEACRRWWPYISDILHNGYCEAKGSAVTGYTNLCTTVLDGWDHELIYKSSPPYQTYELYSMHNGKKIECHAGH